MGSTSPIAPELECEERSELIQQLSDLLQLEYVDSATYAMLWFADLEALRALVSYASKQFIRESIKAVLQNTPHMRYLKMWLGRRLGAPQVLDTPDPPVTESSQSSRKRPSSPTGPPLVPRDYDVRDLAEKPYKNLCVLTKMEEPLEGCHIFPYSISQNSKNDRIQFWGRLKKGRSSCFLCR